MLLMLLLLLLFLLLLLLPDRDGAGRWDEGGLLDMDRRGSWSKYWLVWARLLWVPVHRDDGSVS